MRTFFFIFSTILTFYHCKNTPAPKQYALQAYIRYDAVQRSGQAEAVFKEIMPGMVPRQTEMPGGVQCQGKNMGILKDMLPAYKVRLSDYVDQYRFSWRDTVAGTQTTFEVPMSRIDSFWFEKMPVAKSRTAKLYWAGGDLKKGETLVLIWENTHGQTVQTEVFNPAGMKFLELPSAKLAELALGEWQLYLVRKQLTKTVLQGCEAVGIAEYYTRARAFKVIE